MTAIALRPPSRIARPTLILAGLAGIVGVRWAATVNATAGAVAIGLVFGLGLIAVAFAGGWRPMPEQRRAVMAVVAGMVAGAAGGTVL
ncbi:MAG TPA: hypothetical protein VE640_04710, partial [Candidatus Bathyarchaeia archaeon]|nr:hypothetical protein [Candidatus Bathyarchaeia archaeon]